MALFPCSECGKQVSDKAKTCPQCGCPVVLPLVCAECGELVTARAAACGGCGCPVEAPKQPVTAAAAAPAPPVVAAGVSPPQASAPQLGAASDTDLAEVAAFKRGLNPKHVPILAAAGFGVASLAIVGVLFAVFHKSDCDEACEKIEQSWSRAGYGYGASAPERGHWTELDRRQCRFDCERDDRRHPGYAGCMARAPNWYAIEACMDQ